VLNHSPTGLAKPRCGVVDAVHVSTSRRQQKLASHEGCKDGLGMCGVRPKINHEGSRCSGRRPTPKPAKKLEHTISWEAVDDIGNDDCIVTLRDRILEEVPLYKLNS